MNKQPSKIKSLYELKNVSSDIGTHKGFIKRVQALQAAQQQIDGEWASLKQAMQTNHVQSIGGEWGVIEFRTANYYQVGQGIAPRFTKQAIDGDAVRLYITKHGDAPKGVIIKTVNKFYKGIK